MATSSKVQFNLETLKEKALESIDVRIAEAQKHLDSFEDEAVLQERIANWRQRQEQRISELFRSLGEVGDAQLASWKIQPIPEIETYGRSRAETTLRSLIGNRSKIVAKAESLVPDEDGNISLTKTQLQEFFGL